MKFSELIKKDNYDFEYGSLWAYSPHGQSEPEELSKSFMRAVKGDEMINFGGVQTPTSEVVARLVQENLSNLVFRDVFAGKPVLVPLTSTSLKSEGGLWAALNIATALKNRGLGSMVSELLKRSHAIQKAATSTSGNRPTAALQRESQEVQKMLSSEPESIVLVDDVVTSGATMVGSAQLLKAVYPNARIVGFAAIRTVSLSQNFKKIEEPIFDKTRLYPSGKIHRFPD